MNECHAGDIFILVVYSVESMYFICFVIRSQGSNENIHSYDSYSKRDVYAKMASPYVLYVTTPLAGNVIRAQQNVIVEWQIFLMVVKDKFRNISHDYVGSSCTTALSIGDGCTL